MRSGPGDPLFYTLVYVWRKFHFDLASGPIAFQTFQYRGRKAHKEKARLSGRAIVIAGHGTTLSREEMP